MPADSHPEHDQAHARHAGHQAPAGPAPHAGHGGHAGHGVQVVQAGHAGHAGHEGQAGHADHHAHMIADFRRRFWVSLALTAPILILSPAIQQFLGLGAALRFGGDTWLVFALSSAVYFHGGYPFLTGWWEELRSGRPGMMTLIGLAISTAYFYSSAVVLGLAGMVFFWELATLIDIMLLGHWIEMRSVQGASRALEELARLMPSEAHKQMSDGSVADVPLAQLAPGDRVLVKPGEKVPVDGEVINGETSVNEAMLTGESRPVPKTAGSSVIGGALNGEGAIVVEVKKTGKESFLSQVVELVRAAQASKSRTQDLANRAAFWLTLIAIAGGAVTIVIWLAARQNFSFAMERAVTVMVITCPHALGLAVPLVVAVSTALAAGRGLLIRNRAAFEQARNIQAVLFDKTGTLTQGKFGVTDVITLASGITAEELLNYAAAIEVRSEHPIASGIVRSVPRPREVQEFTSLPGQGAQGRVDGIEIRVVSTGYLRANNLSLAATDPRLEKLGTQGKTVVYVVLKGQVAGAIALADMVRPESKPAIARLKQMGIKTMMLTGDNRQVAKWVAGELGLDDYFAEVLPQDKAAKVKEVQARGLVVAMVGDGVNDAPALAQADVGIAIGAGTDVAVEAADIVLVRSNPGDAAAVIGLAKATYRKLVQNLVWATGYNAFAIPLAAGALWAYGILLSPAMGAALMSVSTVIVAVNATLLKANR